MLIWPRDPKDHWIWDWIRLWSHSIGSLSSFHDRSYIGLYRLLIMEHFSHNKAISPLPGPALVPVLHVFFCWGPAFCWKLPAQLIVMATFTTPCYGSRGRSLRLLSLGIERVNRRSVDVKLCLPSDRSGQVDGESFFVSSLQSFVILSYIISNTIPLLHPKCKTLFKTVKPKFLCQSAIVVYSIFCRWECWSLQLHLP